MGGSREADLLARARRDGDAGAMEELVRRMMPLAHRVARRYHRSSEPIDDLEQAANCGLLGALQRFDPHRGTDFCSYAAASIDGELKRYHRDHCWSTRVPRRAKERALSVHRERERLGRTPSQDELQDAGGVSRDQLLDAGWARDARWSLSLEADQAQALPIPEIEEAGYQRVEDADEFTHLLKLLPVGERRVVSCAFGTGSRSARSPIGSGSPRCRGRGFCDGRSTVSLPLSRAERGHSSGRGRRRAADTMRAISGDRDCDERPAGPHSPRGCVRANRLAHAVEGAGVSRVSGTPSSSSTGATTTARPSGARGWRARRPPSRASSPHVVREAGLAAGPGWGRLRR